MRRIRLATCLLGLAGAAAAQAQESPLGLSAGARIWSTTWTTWSYAPSGGGQVLTQTPAMSKAVIIPLLGARWRAFVASVSGFGETDFGATDSRKELDVNAGYYVIPGLAATVGYKKLSQRGSGNLYEVAGPTVGLSGTASLGGPFSMYGSLGLGRMKDTSASNVKFDAEYQLSEIGFAWNLPLGGLPRSLTFTAGYRMQVLNSKEALGTQDARDLTQGFTLGLVASF